MTIVIFSVNAKFGYALFVPKVDVQEAIVCEVVRLLRLERERQELSINALAQRAGISQSMTSLVERNLRNPTLELLLRLSEALDIDLGGVVTRAERAIRRKM